MKRVLLIALVSSLYGCATAYPDPDTGINPQAATTKQTVYLESLPTDKPCLKVDLENALRVKLEELGFAESLSAKDADMALRINARCEFTQTGRDMATVILPFASFFILPITATTNYSVTVNVSEFGRDAKEYNFKDSIMVITHPFYFGTARDQYLAQIKLQWPAIRTWLCIASSDSFFVISSGAGGQSGLHPL